MATSTARTDDNEATGNSPSITQANAPGGAGTKSEAPTSADSLHLFTHSSHRAGDRVKFQAHGYSTEGTVDTATDDDEVVWIWLDGGRGRVMLFPDDEGVEAHFNAIAASSPPETSAHSDDAHPCWCWQAAAIYQKEN